MRRFVFGFFCHPLAVILFLSPSHAHMCQLALKQFEQLWICLLTLPGLKSGYTSPHSPDDAHRLRLILLYLLKAGVSSMLIA